MLTRSELRGVVVAIVTPFTEDERLAASVDIPVIIYNNPLYTGNNLRPELIAKLADIDGIIGLKQSNADLG